MACDQGAVWNWPIEIDICVTREEHRLETPFGKNSLRESWRYRIWRVRDFARRRDRGEKGDTTDPFPLGMPRFGLFLRWLPDFPLLRASAASGILQFCIVAQRTEESAELRAAQVNRAIEYGPRASYRIPRARHYFLVPQPPPPPPLPPPVCIFAIGGISFFFLFSFSFFFCLRDEENRNERDTYILEFTSVSVPNTPQIYFLVGMERASAIGEISFTLPPPLRTESCENQRYIPSSLPTRRLCLLFSYSSLPALCMKTLYIYHPVSLFLLFRFFETIYSIKLNRL